MDFQKKNGRSERIRTSDPLIPNQVRYQAALRSVPLVEGLIAFQFPYSKGRRSNFINQCKDFHVHVSYAGLSSLVGWNSRHAGGKSAALACEKLS